jgi:tetratricopeptide (TPR) repeat protein
MCLNNVGVVMKSTVFFALAGACLLISSLHGQSNPASPPTVTPETRGDVYMARKMYREAVDAYKQSPTLDALLWNKIAIAYHQLGDHKTAKQDYEKALKLDPNYAVARNNLGTIYHEQKSYRRAIREYKKALELEPTSASFYSNLGTAEFARKRYKEAIEAYQKAVKLDPDVFERRNNVGILLQERTVEERAKFHYYLARTYAQAGMNDRALLCIRKSLEEGFLERKKYLEDPDFAAIREMPEFKELMAAQPRVL